jgi:hypothetical protein
LRLRTDEPGFLTSPSDSAGVDDRVDDIDGRQYWNFEKPEAAFKEFMFL